MPISLRRALHLFFSKIVEFERPIEGPTILMRSNKGSHTAIGVVLRRKREKQRFPHAGVFTNPGKSDTVAIIFVIIINRSRFHYVPDSIFDFERKISYEDEKK